MKTELIVQDKQWQLHRYPADKQHVSLQAWDAADEYLYQHIQENAAPEFTDCLVLNDDFGALACMLPDHIKAWY